MTYQEELHFTQQLLIHIALGNVFEVEGVVFILFSEDYMGVYTTEDHVRVFRNIEKTQNELSLN